MVPSVEQCRWMMEQYKMLPNIRAHSFVVAEVAKIISKDLLHNGVDLNFNEVVAGALLHDIGKTQCLNTDENHAAVGRDICIKHGFDEVADIVGEHVILKNGLSETGCTVKEIVYYSDKRVLHDEIVSLEERLDYILERYGGNSMRMKEAISKNFNRCKLLEKKLFARLSLTPADLPGLVDVSVLTTYKVSMEKAL